MADWEFAGRHVSTLTPLTQRGSTDSLDQNGVLTLHADSTTQPVNRVLPLTLYHRLGLASRRQEPRLPSRIRWIVLAQGGAARAGARYDLRRNGRGGWADAGLAWESLVRGGLDHVNLLDNPFLVAQRRFPRARRVFYSGPRTIFVDTGRFEKECQTAHQSLSVLSQSSKRPSCCISACHSLPTSSLCGNWGPR